jgi:hypothetical protein
VVVPSAMRAIFASVVVPILRRLRIDRTADDATAV